MSSEETEFLSTSEDKECRAILLSKAPLNTLAVQRGIVTVSSICRTETQLTTAAMTIHSLGKSEDIYKGDMFLQRWSGEKTKILIPLCICPVVELAYSQKRL